MELKDMAKYEILYDLPEGDYGEKEVGGIRTRTVRAGEALEVEAFPILQIPDGAKRELRQRKSTGAQQRLNLENARKRMRRFLESNFSGRDIVLHPTFDYGFVDRGAANLDAVRREWAAMGYPLDVDDARRLIKNYIKRLKRLYARNGGSPKDFKYIYVIESTKEPRDGDFNALPARYHYHMVVSGDHLSIDDVNAAWGYGYTKAQALDMRYNGLEGLAKYITKQRGFMRRWEHSRNLKKPEERVSDRKISRRRAALVARDVQANGREIFERLYPGYRLEEARVRYSDFAAGAYIYARMRRHTPDKQLRGRSGGKKRNE